MREHISAIVRSMAAALADAALGALLIALMLALYDVERGVQFALGFWIAVYAVQAVANELMAARGVSLLTFVLVNAALLIPGTHAVVARTAFFPPSTGFPVFLRIITLLCGAHGAACTRRPPGSNLFVRYADALILSASLYLATAFGLGRAYNPAVLAFSLGTLALCMVIASSLRSGGESDSVIRGAGAGGYAVLLALLVLCLPLAIGLLSLGERHVDGVVSLLALLWQGICRGANLLATLLARMIMFFAGKNPNVRSDPASPDVSFTGGIEMPAAAESPEWLIHLLLALLAAGAAAGLIAALLALRRMKFSRVRSVRRRRRIMRRSHFFAALREALRGAYARIAFEIAYRLHKRTPQGLFVLAQRTGRLRRLPRRASESAGAYLRRCHGALRAQGEASSLDQLARLLDAALYGGQDIRLTPGEYSHYAKQIRHLRVFLGHRTDIAQQQRSSR